MKRVSVIMAFFTAAFSVSAVFANAQDVPRRLVVEQLPSAKANTKNIHRVVAAKTPSGFEVPRYVSLKFGKTNGRIGPSVNHPIVWQYRRAGLPVIVVAETENWRKIRDVRGDESWIYKAGLSGERHVIVLKDTQVFKRPDNQSTVVAVAEMQAILRLENCVETLCKVYSNTGLRGWISQQALWGAAPLY